MMEPLRHLAPLKSQGTQRVPEPIQTPVKYGAFELRANGVYFDQPPKKGDTSATPKFVCSRLEVVAHSRDESGQEWGFVLKWKDLDDREHKWSVPRSLVVKTGTELAEALAKGGLNIATGKSVSLVKQYITEVNPSKMCTNVPRPGWYRLDQSGPKKRKVFVLPHRTIGDSTDESIVLQQDTYETNALLAAGTLGEWREKVASLCVGNNLLMFAVSIAFAAPTLEMLGKASGGFHLHGLSSTGKSTALHVAASVWGCPVTTWRTTDNALEDTAERHNDVLLALDELSQVDPRKAGEVAYMLGNGEGKQRLTQSIVAQRKKLWRLMFLSTGEITLADHAQEGGKKTKAGTEVRMVNLDADAGVGAGIFRNIHGSATPAEFADLLKAVASQFKATAGPAFVESLLKDEPAATEKLNDLMNKFMKKYVPENSSGEIFRVADRFALVGAAGELATEAGITGWASGEAMEAAGSTFVMWQSNRPTGSQDLEKGIDQIGAFLLANQHRFEDLTSGEVGFGNDAGNVVSNRVGFRQKVGDGAEEKIEYLVPMDPFKSELCKGYDAIKVAKELAKRGHLRTTKDRLQVQQRIPRMGKQPIRFYAIQSSILGEDKPSEQAESKAA